MVTDDDLCYNGSILGSTIPKIPLLLNTEGEKKEGEEERRSGRKREKKKITLEKMRK